LMALITIPPGPCTSIRVRIYSQRENEGMQRAVYVQN